MNLEELENVDPVNTKDYDSGTVRDEFLFGEVFIGDIPRDFNQSGVDFEHFGDYIEWKYRNRTKIFINEDGAFAHESASNKEAQQQAFFALSILADEGYVSRWSKK